MSVSKLQVLSPSEDDHFQPLVKKINDGEDLNLAMFPTVANPSAERSPPKDYSGIILHLRELIQHLDQIVNEVPPDPGPRRFGNISFRRWHEEVEKRVPDLLSKTLSTLASRYQNDSMVSLELTSYLLGGFGSSQRLDFGTGHELSFLAFIAGLWKLGAFTETSEAEVEKNIVFGVIDPYLQLVRKLIKTYNLEPAGSHGVWGLDDHSFLPYIFGSAQLSSRLSPSGDVPTEGSAPDAPKTGDVVNRKIVEEWRGKNLYFAAIGFIYDVKRGPFWEHSPMLYDISGVPAGWAKINKGMLKMYHAEVLAKFPVVQHFHFGGLFKWDTDPNATKSQATVHTTSQPITESLQSSAMKAPWANKSTTTSPMSSSSMANMPAATGVPWARGQAAALQSRNPDPITFVNQPAGAPAPGMPMTAAPWARSGVKPADGPGRPGGR